MIAKFPAQGKWAEKNFRKIKGLKRIWGTIWEFSPEKLLIIEDFLASKGKKTEKEKIDFY